MKELDNFVKNVREKRKELGLSLKTLEEKAGIGEHVLSNWQSKKNNPTLFSALLIAKALGCTLDELCGMEKLEPTHRDLHKVLTALYKRHELNIYPILGGFPKSYLLAEIRNEKMINMMRKLDKIFQVNDDTIRTEMINTLGLSLDELCGMQVLKNKG